MQYYAHHIGDYIKSTARISIMEEGCYRRLLDIYYDTEAPIPADFARVCKATGAHSKSEKVALAWVLETFFKLEPDGYHNKRCDAEIAECRAKTEQNRINGSRGGRPKAVSYQDVSNNEPEKIQNETQAKPTDNRTLTQLKGNQDPITNNQYRQSLSGLLTHPREAASESCERFADQEPAEARHGPPPQQPLPQQAMPKPIRKTGKAAKAQPFPDDFTPSECHKAYAAEHGLDLSHELHQFKAHHIAKGTLSLSWAMSLTTWLGNARKWAAERKTVTGTGRYQSRTPRWGEDREASGKFFGAHGEESKAASEIMKKYLIGEDSVSVAL